MAALKSSTRDAPTAKSAGPGHGWRIAAYVLIAVQSLVVIGYGTRALPGLYQGSVAGTLVAAVASPAFWIAVVLAGVADSRDGRPLTETPVEESTVTVVLLLYVVAVILSIAIGLSF